MSMTAALGSAGPGGMFTWEGRTYTMMPVDLGIETAFQEWLIMRGRAPLLAMKDALDPEDFAAALAAYSATAPTRFTFWGKDATKARNTVDGMVKMYQLMLSVKHPKVSEKTVRKMMEDVGADMAEAVRSFFPQTKEPDPEETPTPVDLEVLNPPSLDILT